MNKPLRLGFANTFDNAKRFFTDVLGQRYNIIRDDVMPDYLIFGDANFGQNHMEFDPLKIKKIFYTGENVRPNYFSYDHSLSFDHENSPRHYRLPLYVLEMWALVADGVYPNWESILQTNQTVNEKRLHYAAYVQSNPNCFPRTEFVKKLMKDHLVICAGPHLNNTGIVLPRDNIKWKTDLCRDSIFTICYENGSHPGYVTEKILNAFCAASIPVYWGSRTIGRDFNEAAFINRFNFSSDEAMIDYMDEVYADPIKCLEIMNQPAFKDNLKPDVCYLETFLDWWERYVI